MLILKIFNWVNFNSFSYFLGKQFLPFLYLIYICIYTSGRQLYQYNEDDFFFKF